MIILQHESGIVSNSLLLLNKKNIKNITLVYFTIDFHNKF